MLRRKTKRKTEDILDLHSQWEELLNAVLACESMWRLEERIERDIRRSENPRPSPRRRC